MCVQSVPRAAVPGPGRPSHFKAFRTRGRDERDPGGLSFSFRTLEYFVLWTRLSKSDLIGNRSCDFCSCVVQSCNTTRLITSREQPGGTTRTQTADHGPRARGRSGEARLQEGGGVMYRGAMIRLWMDGFIDGYRLISLCIDTFIHKHM